MCFWAASSHSGVRMKENSPEDRKADSKAGLESQKENLE